MSASAPFIELERFSTFGDLLKYLRRRAGLTQRELSIQVGYSIAQISRLEQNQRLPDLAMIAARFVPALDLEDEADIAKRLMVLAAGVRAEDAPASGAPPYKGLNYFNEADADLYFGREALIEKLRSRLLGGETGTPWPFLAVVGASGSGKSSVVRAGLVPALRWNPPSANWPVYLLTPTAHPVEALAASLTRESGSMTATLMDDLRRDPRALLLYARCLLPEGQRAPASSKHTGAISSSPVSQDSGSRLVLIIDQFEELFTLCHNQAERAAFVDNLLAAAFEPDGPTKIVIALRADFYAYCAPHAALRAALAEHQEYIGPMNADELVRAIESPAQRGGWELEAGLAEVILHDLNADGSRSAEPGALPLLSHALLETWQRRRGRALTLSGYLASGGVRGAIAETAENVFRDQLDARQRAMARNLFMRFAVLSDDDEVVWTRRRVAFDELTSTAAEAVIAREVLTCLADARLITTSETAAEVAHEALLREWPRLRGWLAESQGEMRLHRQLIHAAAEWQGADRDPSFLLTGAHLAQFEGWLASSSLALTPDERAFYEASLAERERWEAEATARQRRELETERANATRLRMRNRVIAVAGGIAVVLALIAGLFSFQSHQNATLARAHAATAAQAQADAEQAAKTAFSRELAGYAINNLTIDPERSVLLALQAVSAAHTMEAENALHQAVEASRVRLSINAYADRGWFWRVSYSPNGEQIATGFDDGTIDIWDTATGKNLLTLRNAQYTFSIDFSPDGTRLAVGTGAWGLIGENAVKVWEITSGRLLFTFSGCTLAAYSPNGQHLAVACWNANQREGYLQIWDAATGQHMLAQAKLAEDPNFKLAYSPDGTRLTMSHGNTATLWDATTGQELLTLPQQSTEILGVAFSSDGRRLATAGPNAPVKVWDITPDVALGTNRLLASLPGTQSVEAGLALAFSRDGSKLAAQSGLQNRIVVWDAISYLEITTLDGHTSPIADIAFSPDSQHLTSVAADGKVKIWDVTPSHELLTLSSAAGSHLHKVVFSPDATRLLADTDPAATVWEAATGRELFKLSDAEVFPTNVINGNINFGPVSSVAFSPDGTRIATANRGSTLKDGADGAQVDVWNQTATAAIWDAATGQKLLTLRGHQLGVMDVAFNPDGKWLATASRDGTAMIWDVITGQHLSTVSVAPDTFYLWNVVFSSDGKYLAIAGEPRNQTGNSISQIWEIGPDGQPAAQPAFSYPSLAVSSITVALNPAGNRFAFVSFITRTDIRDISPGASITEPVFSLLGNSDVRGIAFDAQGLRLATAFKDGAVKLWDMSAGVSTARELLTLAGDGGILNGVAFSPDGARLATAGQDGTVRLYALRLEDLIALAKTRVTRTLTEAECVTYLHVVTCPEN